MSNPTQTDDKKRQEEEKKKKLLKETKRATPGAHLLEAAENPAWRDQSIGYNVELDTAVAKGELETLIQRLDVSEINQQGTNNQRQVLEKVQKDLEGEKYFSALGRIIREDIQLTNRTLWSFLRLNRVYQGQRTGTTDVMEMPEARKDFQDSEIRQELMAGYTGPAQNKAAVEMAIRTVANGESGTTQVGLDDLQLAHQLVRNVLKAEFKNKYEDVASLTGSQHGLSGLEMPGVKDMDPLRGSFSNNEKINKFLRLYEVLTIELFDKQQKTVEKDSALKFEKAQVAGSLDKLAGMQGIVLTPQMREEFKNKIAGMESMGPLQFFNFKVTDLSRRLGGQNSESAKSEANAEIQSWLDPSVKFSREEEAADIQRRKEENKARDAKAIQDLRSGKVVTMPVEHPVKKPIEPYERAA
jgi:hypothetical protein